MGKHSPIMVVTLVVMLLVASYFVTLQLLPLVRGEEFFREEVAAPAAEGLIEVVNQNGFVRIESWSGPAVVVEGTKRTYLAPVDLMRMTVDKGGTGVKVTAKYDGIWPVGWCSTDIVVKVPISMKPSVRVTTENGFVRVVLEEASGIQSSTVNGYISISALDSGYVSVSSSNGDIEVRADNLGGLSASTTSGNIYCYFSPEANSSSVVTTVNGNAYVEIPPSSSFRITASSGGEIVASGFTFVSQSASKGHLGAVSGDGSASIAVTATKGNIELRGMG